MRRRLAAVLAVVLVAASLAGPGVATATATTETQQCGFPYEATDATGTTVTVESEPQRIVTLNPSAAQTMWEIGGKEKVVGVSKYAAYLEGAETRANISGSGNSFVNLERVVELEPDLVLAPNTIPNETVERLRDGGITVYKFEFQRSIEDIKQKTLLTGRLTGECEGARETVDWMETKLDRVERAVEGQRKPRVLYVFFGYTAGKGTFGHQVITIAGGRNIATMANVTGYKQISPEVVVKYNPQWIMVNDGAPGIPKKPAYNETYAIQNDQIVTVKEEYVSQPAPRIVYAIVKLAKTFHPEAYERAANGTTTTERTTTTENLNADPTETTTTRTPGQTGFGVGVAVVALTSLVVLVRRGT